MEGVIGVKPKIKKLTWLNSKIEMVLVDGRIVIFPTKILPSLKKVDAAERNKAQIINGDMFTWDTCPEVYHIEQVLGKEKDYKYNA